MTRRQALVLRPLSINYLRNSSIGRVILSHVLQRVCCVVTRVMRGGYYLITRVIGGVLCHRACCRRCYAITRVTGGVLYYHTCDRGVLCCCTCYRGGDRLSHLCDQGGVLCYHKCDRGVCYVTVRVIGGVFSYHMCYRGGVLSYHTCYRGCVILSHV